MSKSKLIVAIHAWLQRFGNRDNETFHYDIGDWHLSLQYHFDLDGEHYAPFSFVTNGSKLVSTNIEEHDENILKEILDELLKIRNKH